MYHPEDYFDQSLTFQKWLPVFCSTIIDSKRFVDCYKRSPKFSRRPAPQDIILFNNHPITHVEITGRIPFAETQKDKHHILRFVIDDGSGVKLAGVWYSREDQSELFKKYLNNIVTVRATLQTQRDPVQLEVESIAICPNISKSLEKAMHCIRIYRGILCHEWEPLGTRQEIHDGRLKLASFDLGSFPKVFESCEYEITYPRDGFVSLASLIKRPVQQLTPRVIDETASTESFSSSINHRHQAVPPMTSSREGSIEFDGDFMTASGSISRLPRTYKPVEHRISFHTAQRLLERLSDQRGKTRTLQEPASDGPIEFSGEFIMADGRKSRIPRTFRPIGPPVSAYMVSEWLKITASSEQPASQITSRKNTHDGSVEFTGEFMREDGTMTRLRRTFKRIDPPVSAKNFSQPRKKSEVLASQSSQPSSSRIAKSIAKILTPRRKRRRRTFEIVETTQRNNTILSYQRPVNYSDDESQSDSDIEIVDIKRELLNYLK